MNGSYVRTVVQTMSMNECLQLRTSPCVSLSLTMVLHSLLKSKLIRYGLLSSFHLHHCLYGSFPIFHTVKFIQKRRSNKGLVLLTSGSSKPPKKTKFCSYTLLLSMSSQPMLMNLLVTWSNLIPQSIV